MFPPPLRSSVAVALGGLTLWHIILISRGETSVERHINRKETRRLQEKGKVHTLTYKVSIGPMSTFKFVFKGFKKTGKVMAVDVSSVVTQLFKNPYHHGHLNNWKFLLGVEKRR